MGYSAAAGDELHVSYSSFLGTTNLNSILATGNGAAADLEASPEETDGSELCGTDRLYSKASEVVYTTVFHYCISDKAIECPSGKYKTGIIGCGTGLVHVDKTNCAGTCAYDSPNVDYSYDKAEVSSY